MNLEVLSEEEIEKLEKRCERSYSNAEKYTDGVLQEIFNASQMLDVLNTIKIQRQQLAEQERKVWNEAIKECAQVAYDRSKEENNFRMRDLILSLLKPESEASGE